MTAPRDDETVGWRDPRLRDAAERLDLQQDLASAGELAAEILRDLVGADRASCRFLAQGQGWEPEAGERSLAVPVRGLEEDAVAVLTAERNPERPPFGDGERELALRLALCARPAFSRLILFKRLDQATVGQEDLWRGRASVFRREALEEYAAGYRGSGDVLRLPRRWIQVSSWLILAAASAALVLAALFPVLRRLAGDVGG